MLPHLLLCLLPFVPTPQDTTPTDNIPDLYEGRWVGTVYQEGYEPYVVRVNIWEAEIGDKAGLIDYTDLGCGGQLILEQRIDYMGRPAVLLTEQLGYGTFRCFNNGVITLYFDEDDQCTAMQWYHPDYVHGSCYIQLYKGM